MSDIPRRNELIQSRLAVLDRQIAARSHALEELRKRIADPSTMRGGSSSTQRQVLAAAESVIADLIAERDRFMRQA